MQIPAFNTPADWVSSATSAHRRGSSFAFAPSQSSSTASTHQLTECYKRPESESFDVSLLENFDKYTSALSTLLSTETTLSENSSLISFFQNSIRTIPRIQMARTKQTARRDRDDRHRDDDCRSEDRRSEERRGRLEDDNVVECHHQQNMSASSVKK